MLAELSGVKLLTHPSTATLCVAKDFSGEFVLEITRDDDVDASPIFLPIKVSKISNRGCFK